MEVYRSPKELAEMSGLSLSTITRVAHEMEEGGSKEVWRGSNYLRIGEKAFKQHMFTRQFRRKKHTSNDRAAV